VDGTEGTGTEGTEMTETEGTETTETEGRRRQRNGINTEQRRNGDEKNISISTI